MSEGLQSIWINQTQQLSDANFEQLLADNYKMLYNFGYTICKDADLVKDTIQELFIHVWENRADFQITSPKNYLLRALRNNLVRAMKKVPNYSEPTEDYAATEMNVEQAIIWQETNEININNLKKIISELTPSQQEVIFLKYYEGLSNDEIASILCINKQSVANSLHKILLKLRGRFLPHFAALTLAGVLANLRY